MELKEVEQQMRNRLCQAIVDLGTLPEQAKQILEYMEDECFLEITAPQEKEPPLQRIEAHVTRSGRYRGSSYKPGNIVINIKKSLNGALMLGISSVASIRTILTSEPGLGILTIITALLSVANMCKLKIEDEAVLLLAVFWENRQYNQIIKADRGFDLVNQKLRTFGRDELTITRYNDLLDELRDMECITLEDGDIVLKESVHISY